VIVKNSGPVGNEVHVRFGSNPGKTRRKADDGISESIDVEVRHATSKPVQIHTRNTEFVGDL
jgi:hypothetical protein